MLSASLIGHFDRQWHGHCNSPNRHAWERRGCWFLDYWGLTWCARFSQPFTMPLYRTASYLNLNIIYLNSISVCLPFRPGKHGAIYISLSTLTLPLYIFAMCYTGAISKLPAVISENGLVSRLRFRMPFPLFAEWWSSSQRELGRRDFWMPLKGHDFSQFLKAGGNRMPPSPNMIWATGHHRCQDIEHSGGMITSAALITTTFCFQLIHFRNTYRHISIPRFHFRWYCHQVIIYSRLSFPYTCTQIDTITSRDIASRQFPWGRKHRHRILDYYIGTHY